ncbi:MAG: family 16 glycosylhydrolase [Granulosicoccus sp.]
MKLIRFAQLLPMLCLTVFSGFALAITTPSDLSAIETEPGTVLWAWEEIEGAVEYQVTVDGAFTGSTDTTSWVSEDLWKGNHSLTVKAVDSDGAISVQSDTLKIKVQHIASTPADTGTPVSPSLQDAQSNADDTGLIDPASYNYSGVTDKSGYELVFSDEFNANSLNPARWHSQLRWDGEWNGERYEYRVINNESQFYVNVLSPDAEHQEEIVPLADPFEFDGSRLAIRSMRNPLKSSDDNKSHGRLLDMAEQQEFMSGAISTHEKFSRKYGYFEASIKIPSHVGTFPAFWLYHSNRKWEGTQRTEIDIMENLGHMPTCVYNTFHYWKNVSEYNGGDANMVKPKPSGQICKGVDYSEDFHVYAVEWEPGKITWFIDGEQVSQLEHSEIDYEELYLMINLAMGGNWTNFPTNAGGLGRSSGEHFPTDNDINEFQNPALEIDYVRVFERR